MAFEYTPYRNPYIGTIADLMARGEDAKAKALIDVASAQARAAEAKGQIYGNAISSIGQQIGNIPAQMQANKEQAFKADQQARMVRGQQREDAAENEFNRMFGSKNELGGMFGPMSEPVVTPGVMGTDMEPDTPETRTLPSRAYMPTVTNPFKELSIRGVDGLDKWDVEKASQQFASMGLGVQGQKYLELMRGSNDDMDKHHASAMDLVKKSAARALQAGSFDMMLGSTNALMSQLANNKVIGREDLSAFQQQLDGLNALPQEQKENALQGLLRNISGIPEEEYTLNLDDVRVRGNKVIASNPRGVPPVTLVGRVFELENPATGATELVQSRSDGSLKVFGKPPERVQPAGPRPTYVTLSGPSGEQRQMETGPEANTLLSQGWKISQSGQAGEKPSSGLEKRVLNFFNRAEQADRELEALEKEIQETDLSGQLRMSYAPEILQNQTGQLYTAAQRAFTEARLRKDSGAAIPEHEFENDRRTYFAQPGNTAITLESKRRARATILASLAFESGKALGEYAGGKDEAEAIINSYKTRSKGKQISFDGSGKINVTAPDGTMHAFDTQAQADAFKKLVSGK